MHNKIVEYYDRCEVDYRLFWHLEQSLALHAGYWDRSTKNLKQALQRENELLAEIAKIQKSDTVLDAGCGVGGSALYLAQHYHCQVIGITLSSKQVHKALQKAKQRMLLHKVDFKKMDYCQTTFPDQSFDVVWGLESVCHAPNKKDFLKEAFRILKPGGRLVVADGFANKSCLPPKERYSMAKWLNGWGVEALETVDNFSRNLTETSFRNCSYQDITKNVMPSSKRLHRLSLPAACLSKIGEWLGLRTKEQTANLIGAFYQYKTLKQNLWQYGIFYAEK